MNCLVAVSPGGDILYRWSFVAMNRILQAGMLFEGSFRE